MKTITRDPPFCFSQLKGPSSLGVSSLGAMGVAHPVISNIKATTWLALATRREREVRAFRPIGTSKILRRRDPPAVTLYRFRDMNEGA